MKTSQSNRLNITVSFNKHISDVFYCKHSSGNIEKSYLLWTLKIECVKQPISANGLTKQTDTVSLGRNRFETKRFCV